ncbi:hypothetical protein FDK21_09820 [Cohaesibacter sp. CAU 1516]|uniref:hypothetical protein n=1 Tax=Cohaesibacter sp. CAU 1516 TaxID=2576038 RepID=UPI0010FF5C28|nr:hypothetical protein [Cohaesibacter sp. CAU 1516]TLP45926.1 hypothetical protein FDK21_09820 [Cohaesibacter sp. CAU 1516]
MDLLRQHLAPKGVPSNMWFDAVRRQATLLMGLCVVLSLTLMQWQVCTSALANESSLMVICTDGGISVVEVAGEQSNKQKSCNRCPDCQTCSSGAFGMPDSVSEFVTFFSSGHYSKSLYETLHIGTPDHLLPFSGAPPPNELDQTMLTSLSESVRFASSEVSIMPESISWH